MFRGVVAGAIGAVFLVLCMSLMYYKNAYEEKSGQFVRCKGQADGLIATLKHKELRLKEFMEQKQDERQKIITKYKIIKQKDEDCQSFREGVHEVLDVFYSHPPP
ncbi:hypothetical protein BBW65_05515 [Helicobacter enhydrae]|uniref:Uncharacterized protein n=1 Tax=Helicobacter enhydrae TaxID=222136 RepID=A0A1B1U6A5_9HELI|nr:hypothetical protein [Helicobacter enhydrae]ANV98288.1 hypothetical protein BBW65_05515 [Helicobacter enhydrae]